ncbi:MAG TPA: hypothetical protein PLT30_01025 [Deltaproteobacteria bacterium]|nr:hypothetical protein [Deltaproteobacteria bacterium]
MLFYKEIRYQGLIKTRGTVHTALGSTWKACGKNDQAAEDTGRSRGIDWGKDDPLLCLKQAAESSGLKRHCRSVLSITLTETSFLMPEDGT